jgi:hypothetical protein
LEESSSKVKSELKDSKPKIVEESKLTINSTDMKKYNKEKIESSSKEAIPPPIKNI